MMVAIELVAVQRRPVLVGKQIHTWLRRITNFLLVVVPLLFLSFQQHNFAAGCFAGAAAAFMAPRGSSAIISSHLQRLQLSASSKSTSSSQNWGCNHLLNMTRLANADFFAVRHGQSKANVARLIASNPATATSSYGLTSMGRAAAEKAANDVIKIYRDREKQTGAQQKSCYQEGIVILSSDLLRAKETATILANTIQQDDSIPLYDDNNNSNGIVLDVRLRERWFGDWDGTSDANYENVWAEDAANSAHTNHNVESVDSVMERATACIVEWNNDILSASSSSLSSTPWRWMVLVVAHGDVLQILQTAFEKKDGRLHRSLPHLETAQVRPLVLSLDSSSE
jgi:broad specificity phosphatase PhoE